jgi:hypothetical protein
MSRATRGLCGADAPLPHVAGNNGAPFSREIRTFRQRAIDRHTDDVGGPRIDREPEQADLAIRHIELGALPGVDRHLTKVRSKKFALDSALEGGGFELSVPGDGQSRCSRFCAARLLGMDRRTGAGVPRFSSIIMRGKPSTMPPHTRG